MQGTPSDLSKSDNDFAQLLEQDASDEEDEEEKETDDQTINSNNSRRSSTKSVPASRDTLASKEGADGEKGEKTKEQAHQMEGTSKGTVKGSISWNYVKSSGTIILPFIVVVLYAVTQVAASFSDWWVSYFTEQEEMRTFCNNNNISIEITSPFQENFEFIDNTNKISDLVQNTLNATLYEAEEVAYLPSTDFLIAIHGIVVALIFIIGILRSIGFFTMAVRASQIMHDAMFSSLIRVS